MMTSADRQLLSDHLFALREHSATMRMVAPMLLAALPQIWTERELTGRWGMTIPQVLAFLAARAGLDANARTARVPVEVVLRLDTHAKAGCSVDIDAGRN